MRKFEEDVIDLNGNAVSGATVDVYNQGTLVHPTIYSDNGITPKPNPTSTNSTGTYSFYVASGRYDITISGSGITTRTKSDVEIVEETVDGSGVFHVDSAGTGSVKINSSTNSGTGGLIIASGGAVPSTVATITSAGLATFGSFVLPTSADTGVGKITTDTLLNKTLTGVGSGNNVTLVNQQGSLTGVVPNGAETTLYSYTLAANTLQAGKGLRWIIYWQKTAGAGVTAYKIYLDGSGANFHTFNDQATDTSISYLAYEIFNNTGVQNAQTITNRYAILPTTGLGAGLMTETKNFANALTLKITATVAAGTTITPKFWLLELIQ